MYLQHVSVQMYQLQTAQNARFRTNYKLLFTRFYSRQ